MTGLALTRRSALAGIALAITALAVPVHAQAPLQAVASFTILGDLVAEIGGDRVAVTTLVNAGGDAHVFEPGTRDARTVGGADIVFANGLGFDPWMDRLATSTEYAGPFVVVSAGVMPLRFEDEDEGADHAGHEHEHDDDPHAWQSVANVRLYVATIADALVAADPAGEASYRANLAAYLAELDALEADIVAAVASLPEANRTVITSHDAFGYFGAAYGLTFLAPVGVSTEAEATPAAVARLIDQIRATGVRAVFIESMTNPRLIEQIARETGATFGGELYADALSPPDGPAPTYLAMMRYNIETIAAALR
ncbi:MAG: metal ABC transporter substrate-binding protein [Bauldia sp.]|nr:metal ABC transporter substrate-binding protein [Bauldia sp.]MCW5716553.1 metal ABC transporter substrate-binding protein [Bauldia sp.]